MLLAGLVNCTYIFIISYRHYVGVEQNKSQIYSKDLPIQIAIFFIQKKIILESVFTLNLCYVK